MFRLAVFCCVVLSWAAPTLLLACPFCESIGPTIADEIKTADLAATGRLVRIAKPPEPAPTDDNPLGFLPEGPKGTFEVTHVFKGDDDVQPTGKIETAFAGTEPVGSDFLLLGYREPQRYWSTPMALPGPAGKYVLEVVKLPESGPERLRYFLDYLQHSETMLDKDAYDEFAKAPYEDVKALAPHFNREKLWKWIGDDQIAASRKRLYYLMLSLCGQAEDREKLEQMLVNRSHDVPTEALDSIIAAYLALAGVEGMPLIEEQFFTGADTSREDVFAAVTAVRFHGEEEDIIPRPRLQEAFRRLLDKPQTAELVVSDLARWEDWTVMDRLVELFRTAEPSTYFIRTPVVQYLSVCPLPEAKQYLEELKAIDPQAVTRGMYFAQADSSTVPPPAPSARPPRPQPSQAEHREIERATPPDVNDMLKWSLVAVGISLLALIGAFIVYRRRQHDNDT